MSGEGRYGTQYGPDITFLGVDRCDLGDPPTYADADVVVVGAPFDGGTSHRPGTRFGPTAIRQTDYLPQDGSRPHLALRVDALRDLRVVDAGDVEFGSLYGHGQPMRRLIESGALRGDRFLQVGLRGYWPGPETLAWMAAQRMRSYEMTEIGHRGLDECLTEASTTATDERDGVFLSVDIDVCDPGHAPGTGTPEPGGLTARQLLDSVRRICLELPVVGVDVVEVSPPYDHAEITAALANRVVLEALSALARRRRDAAGGDAYNPDRPLLER